MDYQLLDSGYLQKLEQAGEYLLVRPALNAFWRNTLKQDQWDSAAGVFVRDSSGGGKWQWRGKVPESWIVRYAGFQLLLKPTGFGHLGFFAEQYLNWEWFQSLPKRWGGGELHALNLFGYSGVGSMAMAAGGFATCHLDASKGMNDWGKENLKLNPQVPDNIRWIADDVVKFCQREIRRGSRYNLIALDPPSFGRGSSGQLWKIEEDLPKLLQLCRELASPSGPFALALSCHSPGFSPLVLERMVRDAFGKKGRIESAEMSIPEKTGSRLPAGVGMRLILE